MTGRFRRGCFVVLVMVFGLLLAGAPNLRAADKTDGGIQWFSYDQGLAQAKQQGKKVFLYFYTDWCHYCKQMASNTLVDKKVIAKLTQEFVSIQVNSDKVKDVASKYKVRGIPASFFLEANGQEIGSRSGYLKPDDFLQLLEFVKAEGYKQ